MATCQNELGKKTLIIIITAAMAIPIAVAAAEVQAETSRSESIPAWCSGIRDYYDSRLEGKSAKFPLGNLASLQSREVRQAPSGFKPHSVDFDPDGEPPTISVSTTEIRGRPVSIVSVTSSHDCSASTHIEIWSSNLKQYFGNVEDALEHATDGGDQPEFATVNGRLYIVNEHYLWRADEIDVIGFTHDLRPYPVCRVVLENRSPEKTLSAIDKGLCETVASGKAKELDMTDVHDSFLKETDFGSIPKNDADAYEIFKRGRGDILNEGHLKDVVMVRASGTRGAGCGFDNLAWEWPMFTKEDGSLDRDANFNSVSSQAGNQVSRLITYKAKIYIDSHSLPHEATSSHTVSAVSAKGIQTLCSFDPLHYVIEQIKSGNLAQ